MENQDKKGWCEYGESLEKQFLVDVADYPVSFMRNPAKCENKYTHDFYGMFPVDLKTIQTKFRTADRYGINPDYAITINRKDIERYYRLYRNIILILDIRFESNNSIRFVSLQTLVRHIKNNDAKEHFYKDRIDDSQGNAKSSFVFDYRWFDELKKGE